MIITKEFIILNYPKTGSSFVREVIKKLYKIKYSYSSVQKIAYTLGLLNPPIKELILPNYQSPVLLSRKKQGQHGAYCQIPNKYIDRKILSVVRNPYTKFLSGYEFGWWKKNPPINTELINEFFPKFPNLSLNEYVEMLKLNIYKINDVEIGNQTVQFIRMFFKEPDHILTKINNEYINSSELFLKDIGNITFLSQENLNIELGKFLSQNGFSKNEVDFAQNYKKVNVTNINSKINRNSLWSVEALEYIEKYDNFLLIMLNTLGFEYKKQ